MASTMQLNLVFRLGEIGFVLPVGQLIEIREGIQKWLDRSKTDSEQKVFGTILFRGRAIPVYDLGERLGLSAARELRALTILILGEAERPWGLAADQVDGIFPCTDFTIHELPLLLRREQQVYDSLDIWRGEPLIHCDLRKISAGWIAE